MVNKPVDLQVMKNGSHHHHQMTFTDVEKPDIPVVKWLSHDECFIFFSTIETFPSAGSVSTHRNTLCSLSKVLLISFRAG